MSAAQIHFVTGRLAEPALRSILADLAPRIGFGYSVQTMNITVAALMTADWVAARLEVPPGSTQVMVTGYCLGDLAVIAAKAGVPVERGPKDLRLLPAYFGESNRGEDYGAYDIQIVAEINHAASFSLEDLQAEGLRLAKDGADLIDVGCDPGATWEGVADAVKALRDAGLRVSIDSLNPVEIAAAVKAGAELVLSVNSSNVAHAAEWGCEVVVIPDDPKTLAGLDETIAWLEQHGVRYRIDPILEPISFGFAESLARYVDVRRRYPAAEIFMGIGNLTELTDVDSAGVNTLLLGFCQELGIRGVLTTQVINWARTSVKECDLARRLMHYAVQQKVLPKRIEPQLVTLRDERVVYESNEDLERLAATIRDNNYRLFADGESLHLVSRDLHLTSTDPFELFAQLMVTAPTNVDPSHAFYLGFELCKALTANQLSKQYRQDESLDWGYLTQAEKLHRLARGKKSAPEEES
ncbi:DUF6513 domain-containing protein [Blastopirellula sp. JC732]|uniref:DUF6513 domain-containing protein n=1 Tax=Blastopirellula sediminis TaxID=2894196 RepID=A0A9X1SHB6_9BACT|nr:DUF6513 domain-containing protein [Blastopirellula sediminis]MCC9608148.1 DUF6513 domain-containing protein [Blastopirellula sediminis]MCC9627059.1 DUF6513 domain-containing protein [Blastopirellula sediminis]